MWLRFKSCCNIGCRRIGFFVLKMIKSRDHVVTVVVCKESMRFIIITLLYVAVKMFVALGEFFSFNFCCCKTSKSIVWNLLQCFFFEWHLVFNMTYYKRNRNALTKHPFSDSVYHSPNNQTIRVTMHGLSNEKDQFFYFLFLKRLHNFSVLLSIIA